MAESGTGTTDHGRHLVLVGGGHSHVYVLKAFGERPMAGVRLTLVSRRRETPYSGMLPGHMAGFYSHAQCHLDLARLAAFAGARLVVAEAVGLDRNARLLHLEDGTALPYDLLSLDIGSTPRTDDVPGALSHATPLKPVDHLSARWQAVVERAEAAPRPLALAVVGGGAAGIEVALCAEHRLRGRATVTLVTAGRVLAGGPARARRLLLATAAARGIAVEEQAPVARVEAGRLRLADGRTLPFDDCLWATQAAGAPWLRATGLALDEAGFIRVGPTLQSETDPRILAAGDVATMVAHRRPKAGVMAVRQGPPLAENLRRLLNGTAPQPFRPQRRFLALIGTGDGRAVAAWGPFAVAGRWVWRWKDRIDRRWMAGFQSLPAAAATGPDQPAEGTSVSGA